MKAASLRATRSHQILVPAPPGRVFPLFEPMGEKKWAEGWEPKMLFPANEVAEEGAVFVTTNAHKPRTLWMIIHHDPMRYEVSYVRVNPESEIGRIDIRCEAAPHEATRATVTYTLTAVSEEGNAFVAKFTEEHFREWLADWERAITQYLQTGTRPAHH